MPATNTFFLWFYYSLSGLTVLGGILPVVCAIGYYVTYRGLISCPNGLAPFGSVDGWRRNGSPY